MFIITLKEVKIISTQENRNKLWSKFDKLSPEKKINWLLCFECINESIKDWDDDFIKDKIDNL